MIWDIFVIISSAIQRAVRSAQRSIQRIFNATEPLHEHQHNVRELPFEHYQIIYRVQPWDAG
jgi:hypothetical protein